MAITGTYQQKIITEIHNLVDYEHNYMLGVVKGYNTLAFSIANLAEIYNTGDAIEIYSEWKGDLDELEPETVEEKASAEGFDLMISELIGGLRDDSDRYFDKDKYYDLLKAVWDGRAAFYDGFAIAADDVKELLSEVEDIEAFRLEISEMLDENEDAYDVDNGYEACLRNDGVSELLGIAIEL